MNVANNTTNNTGGNSEGNSGQSTIQTIILSTLGALAVLTNAPLLVVLITRRAKTTPVFCARMTYLVGNLALADCLTGVAVLLSTFKVTKYHFMIVWTTVEASYFTLLVVSIERFIVLAYPLTWPFILSNRRTFLCIACTWLVSITCGVSVHFYKMRVQFVLTIVFEVLVFSAITLHLIIYFHLQKRHRKFCERFSELSTNRTKMISPADQSNATKVILILLVILVVTVVPYVVLVQVAIAHFLGYIQLSKAGIGIANKLYRYLYFLELVNFIVNPFVYAWRIKRYREAFQETFVSILHLRSTSKDFAARVI